MTSTLKTGLLSTALLLSLLTVSITQSGCKKSASKTNFLGNYAGQTFCGYGVFQDTMVITSGSGNTLNVYDNHFACTIVATTGSGNYSADINSQVDSFNHIASVISGELNVQNGGLGLSIGGVNLADSNYLTFSGQKY